MRKYAPFLLLFVFLNSCSGESEVNLIDPNLEGQWTLTEAQCFCFFPEDFNFAVHRIAFDTENNRINIVNDFDSFFILEEGSYVVSAFEDTLIINEELEYRYSISNNQLRLIFVDDPNISDDEITLIYRKENGIFTSP